jgi:hypothetical protein
MGVRESASEGVVLDGQFDLMTSLWGCSGKESGHQAINETNRFAEKSKGKKSIS